MKNRSKYIDIILPLANTITTGIFMGLVANILFSGGDWSSIIDKLGWWNLITPLWLILIILNIQRYREIRKDVKNVRLKILKDFENKRELIIENLFKILIETTIYPRKSASINVHIFFRDFIGNKKALIKDRRFSYEKEQLPGNYSLDYVFPSEDNLVICDSFNQDTLLYEELPSDHMKHYNERIKNKVDANIKWVLACPLHNSGQEPLGVICCFGKLKFFKNTNELNSFEEIIFKFSEIVIQLKSFENNILVDDEVIL